MRNAGRPSLRLRKLAELGAIMGQNCISIAVQFDTLCSAEDLSGRGGTYHSAFGAQPSSIPRLSYRPSTGSLASPSASASTRGAIQPAPISLAPEHPMPIDVGTRAAGAQIVLEGLVRHPTRRAGAGSNSGAPPTSG